MKKHEKHLRVWAFCLTVLLLLSYSLSIYAESIELTDEEQNLTETTIPIGELTGPSVNDIGEDMVIEEVGSYIDSDEDQLSITSTTATQPTYSSLGAYTIPDGIYALRNAYSGHWLTLSDYTFIQQNYTISPSQNYRTESLFQITQVGSSGQYIVRSMSNNFFTFGPPTADGNVGVQSLPANNENVSITNTFEIFYNSTYDGYIIRDYVDETMVSVSSDTTSTDVYYQNTSNSTGIWIVEGCETVVEDGVYAFKNLQNSSMWMHVQNDEKLADAKLQQYSFSGISPASSFTNSGLFKISRMENSEWYIIRSMTNNRLSFGFNGDHVVTKYIHTNDNAVSIDSMFRIYFHNGGYVLHPYGSSTVILTAPLGTTSSLEGSSESYLDITTLDNSGKQAKWTLEKYTGTEKYDAEVLKPEQLIVGESAVITPIVWTTRINANEPDMYVNSAASNIVTGVWNDSAKELILVLQDEGAFQVHFSIQSGSTVVHSLGTITYQSLPLKNGSYYLENVELGNFMQVDNAHEDSPASAEHMEVHDFYSANYQKWNFTHIQNGYYRITPLWMNQWALSVNSDHLDDNHALEQTKYTGEDYQLWKIDKLLSDGSYIIRPKSGESYSTDWCMAASGGLLADGRTVEQKNYTNNTDINDRWYLHLCNTYVRIEYTARIYYDNSGFNVTDLQKKYEAATAEFVKEFNVSFRLEHITYSEVLNLDPACQPDASTGVCGSNCSSSEIYCTTSHHRSGSRLLKLLTSDNYYTLRVVGYSLCRYSDGSHSVLLGIGNKSGKNSAVTFANNTHVVTTIQHELTHNLGADHCNDFFCIFNNNLNNWCLNCQAAIRDHLYG